MSSTRTELVLALGALVLCAVVASTELRLNGGLGWPLDDAWIHQQFAANLAAGDGLTFNPGEAVAGSTAPLWTAAVALLHLFPGPPMLWTKLVGSILFAMGIIQVRRLGCDLELPDGFATIAATLTVLTGWLVWSALSGLEIPLFILLSIVGLRLHLRDRLVPCGIPLSLPLLALACLARPEGLLLWLAAVVDRGLFLKHEPSADEWRTDAVRATVRGVGVSLLVWAPVVVFNLTISGSLLPTSAGAKAVGLARLAPDLQYLYTVLGIFFRSQPYAVILAGAGCLVLLRQAAIGRRKGALAALWLFGLPLAYSLIGSTRGALVGNFGRYFFPLFPILIVMGVLGLAQLKDQLRALPRWAWALGLALLFWPTVTDLVRATGRYVQNVRNVEDSDVKMAGWLRSRLPAEAVLAVNDIGAIKALLPNRVVDLAGIATPEIRSYEQRAAAAGRSEEEGMLEFLADSRPDYLVIFPNWFPRLSSDRDRFRPLHEVTIPHNITMGGDQLVLYSTPWTRYPLTEAAP